MLFPVPLGRWTLALVSRLFVIAALCYGVLVSPARASETFLLAGPIFSDHVPYVREYLAREKAPVILIDTPGGEVDAAVEIIGAIRAHGNVTCIVQHRAYSAGFAIFQACRNRVMRRGAKLLTHEPKVNWGPVDRVAAGVLLQELERAATSWNDLCRWRLPMTAAAYERHVRGRDWELDADEAMRVDAVDRVVP